MDDQILDRIYWFSYAYYMVRDRTFVVYTCSEMGLIHFMNIFVAGF